ncbi:MAG: mechanosensitive ion channel [Chitinivibrionales bacterium]|nr:mechanosensitive ion channel [Chitinivibrionales bacterium]MBD3394946.1 mechanosensitive ion channel [Chitinivibrionales bacterium]
MTEPFQWNQILPALLEFLQDNILGIVLSLVVLLIVSGIATGITNKYVEPAEKKLAIRKWIRYITFIFGLAWLLVLYGSHTGTNTPMFLFVVGMFLAGVAISMRDVFSNFVAWTIIASGKGFSQGDRIRIGSLTGDVIDVGLLRTVLAEIGDWVGADQSTGRLVSMPNSMVLTHEIYNYTQGYDFIWDEVKILVTFESDWQKAEEIMTEVAFKDFEEKREQIQERLKRVRSRYLLRFNYISPKVYVRIADSGVELALRYMVRTRRRRTLEDFVAREILNRFAQEKKIDFAYPTMRFYRMGEEVERARQ